MPTWIHALLIGTGLVFLWTGAIKAIAPATFANHLRVLGMKEWMIPLAVTLVVALEISLGVALVVGAARGFFLPLTILLLVSLSAISWWGVKSGKADDCGCYGGVIEPSIGQSVGFNFLLAAVVGYGWSTDQSLAISGWQGFAIGFAGASSALLTEASQWFEVRTGKPVFNRNPLKHGAAWKHKWAGGATAGIKGEALVTFMGPDCPYCIRWVPIANAIVQSPQLPRVIGVMATPPDKLDEFKNSKGIRFPLATVTPATLNRLVTGVPTTVHIRDGVIQRVWTGDMPGDFVDRFRDAFFPVAATRPSQQAAS